jgi:hypothetical protein
MGSGSRLEEQFYFGGIPVIGLLSAVEAEPRRP